MVPSYTKASLSHGTKLHVFEKNHVLMKLKACITLSLSHGTKLYKKLLFFFVLTLLLVLLTRNNTDDNKLMIILYTRILDRCTCTCNTCTCRCNVSIYCIVHEVVVNKALEQGYCLSSKQYFQSSMWQTCTM